MRLQLLLLALHALGCSGKESIMKKSKFLFLILLTIAIVANLGAQSSRQTGAVRGTVSDAEGVSLPGVTVTAAGPKLMGTSSVIS